MSDHSIKNQEKVLKILIQLQKDSRTGWIYRPPNFERNFSFVCTKTLIDLLAMLEAKGYINVVYSDLPDSFNIETIYVTPKGLDYAPQKQLAAKERWLERLYGFIVGIVLASIINYIVPVILPRIGEAIKLALNLLKNQV